MTVASKQKINLKQALAMRDKGQTYQQIADRFDVCRSAAYLAVRSASDPDFKEARNKYHREWSRQRYAAGLLPKKGKKQPAAKKVVRKRK
jgi:hypothetical protein